jgi:hypothetical protein
MTLLAAVVERGEATIAMVIIMVHLVIMLDAVSSHESKIRKSLVFGDRFFGKSEYGTNPTCI